MLGSLMLDLKGMRTIMFQLSGFYYKGLRNATAVLKLKPNQLDPTSKPKIAHRS